MICSKLLFLNLGGGEIFVIVLVVLIFFGAKGVPEIAKGLGKGMREFRDAMTGVQREIENSMNSAEENKPQDTEKLIEKSKE